jgi:exodeoxyribonuclease VII small subunit
MSTPEDQVTAPSFEEALDSLQQIVSDLEGGSITLDASLQRFEQGIGLLRQCYQFLERAEQRIEQLVSLDAQGNCTLVPFDAKSTVEKQSKTNGKSAAKRGTRAKDPDAAPPGAESANADIDDKFLF